MANDRPEKYGARSSLGLGEGVGRSYAMEAVSEGDQLDRDDTNDTCGVLVDRREGATDGVSSDLGTWAAL